MIGYALAFTAGDLLLQQFSQLPSLFALLILSGIAAIMARLRYRYLLFFILGFLAASAFGYYQLSDRLSAELEGFPLTITGKILNLPDQNSQRANFELSVLESAKKLPSKLKLSWYEPTKTLHVGETWRFAVKLKRPHANFNDGGMDYER